MSRQLLIWPDQSLRKRAEVVTEFDDKLVQLVIDLHANMDKFNGQGGLPEAAGLAAPQLGVNKRVFVYKLNLQGSCMINPVILEAEDEQYEQEGCLSFPGVYVKVKRADKILVEFQDVEGNTNRLKTDGFVSRCIQHEIDHLNGETFLKALSKVKRDFVTAKMRKIKRRAKQAQEFREKFLAGMSKPPRG